MGTGAREDFEVVQPLHMADEAKMAQYLDHETVEDVSKPPVVEGDDAPEQEVTTTYTPEEEDEEEQKPEQQEQQQQEEVETPATEQAEESTSEADPVYQVTVAGEDMEVPVSELVRGYSRTADYTRKTQQLSEERREFESEIAQLRAERERNAQLYEQGSAWLESMMTPDVDMDALRKTDPAEYAAQLAEQQQRREQLRLVNEERLTLQQRELEQNQRALTEHLKRERDQLEQALPEWTDQQTAEEELGAMRQTALQLGFTPEEVDNVGDHRAVLVLRKAMLYDRIQAGKPQVVQKAKRAPVLKPGAAPSATRKPAPSRLTRAREALRETGSPKAAEAFFFEALQQEK